LTIAVVTFPFEFLSF